MSETRPPDDRTTTPPLGEVAFAGGFRRVSRHEPLALARLRELLLDVALHGSTPLREALEGFESWRSLGVLCGGDWTAGVRRGSVAGRRLLQRRLRALGVRPAPLSTVAALPVGSPVHLRGIIRPLSQSRLNPHMSYIWSHSEMSTDNVRLVVEEGHDFFLTDDKDPRTQVQGLDGAEAVRVIAARGHLVNADQLAAGDRVSVFGFIDRMAHPHPAGAQRSGRELNALAVRAGDDSPLLIRRVCRG